MSIGPTLPAAIGSPEGRSGVENSQCDSGHTIEGTLIAQEWPYRHAVDTTTEWLKGEIPCRNGLCGPARRPSRPEPSGHERSLTYARFGHRLVAFHTNGLTWGADPPTVTVCNHYRVGLHPVTIR
ncbi:hypothetical protein GCM10009551_049600 [Nocardiopsis tropica]